MTKLDQNFDYWTGTDKTLAYGITDSTGASKDVAGMTVWWLLQDEPGSASLMRLKTGGSGITLSGSVVSVTLAASLTAGCANLSGTFYTELSASDSASNADILAVGYATINKKG